nr:immunoglobulin heavy chain junction region [Macaca mulatta]MOW46220.1 immunoglobulin heavy chain junction region [Macaca mulatta]MOW46564.1 immunoglobulin heavy chain junction region [Macaca mulatta]MOW47159.1 immunoglobulin heavy chain junction region [Macaca mulatta]MOW47922.1 immunoglobulin heavy chain junction region [Macaca mulatta]
CARGDPVETTVAATDGLDTW